MGFQEHTVSTTDGLKLFVRDYAPRGEVRGLPVLCLHGLTRNSADFESVAPRIAGLGRRVIAPGCARARTFGLRSAPGALSAGDLCAGYVAHPRYARHRAGHVSRHFDGRYHHDARGIVCACAYRRCDPQRHRAGDRPTRARADWKLCRQERAISNPGMRWLQTSRQRKIRFSQ